MKKRSVTTTIALMLLAATVSFSITLTVCSRNFNEKLVDLEELVSEYEKVAEVQSVIDRYYVNEYDRAQVSEGAAVGMIAYLGDRWSYYLNPEQYESFKIGLNNQMVGIGVNVIEDLETGGILIVNVHKGSPAEEGGLRVRDVVIAIDGTPVTELGYETAVNAVRGEEGTQVTLTFLSDGVEKTSVFTRRMLEIQAISSQILDGNIGYVSIANFDLNVDQAFISAVKDLQKANVSAIVFDVRDNPGGSLQSLMNMLDYLLPECLMFRQVDKAGNAEEYRSDANCLDIPMAVLVNENSISAAEFFAASLQEHEKATVVGMPTTGKGCSQMPIELSDGSAIVLSVNKYYTSKGVDLASVGGIKPDVQVELTVEEIRGNYLKPVTEDRQVQAALSAVKQ